MNYRHQYHAGNFADVVKHVALVAILLHLRRKPSPFAVIDTHAGRGLYDLSSEAARATGEAGAGIGRLRSLGGDLPAALSLYLRIAGDETRYPGSPLVAANLLRDGDRLVAIEKHPEEAEALRVALAPFANARTETGDGYARLAALLPPAERRGLVLVDPPFEAADEFEQAARALRAAWRRFATGIYLAWFPVKSLGDMERFCGEILSAGVAKALRIELDIAPGKGGARLTRSGLLVLNPPYGFAGEMVAALTLIEPRLAERAESRIDWIAGRET